MPIYPISAAARDEAVAALLASIGDVDTQITASLAARTITAGAGLAGGGTLVADRAISLSSASVASLALADTAQQPGSTVIDGGTA